MITAHDEVDYARVVELAPLVVDFRGVTRGLAAPEPGPPVGPAGCSFADAGPVAGPTA